MSSTSPASIYCLDYALALLFQLKTHAHVFATEAARPSRESNNDQSKCLDLLILLTVLVFLMAHILVHSLEVRS